MRAFEIYSGVGGMGIGFEAAGIQVSGGVDSWDRVGYVRTANGIYYQWADASDLTRFGGDLDRCGLEMIIGGPPCQDFSVAGNKQAGKNAAFTRSFALLVATARPQWFVFENVPDAAKSEEYAQARKIWKTSGYGLTELFLDASYYGVPQARERLIVVGRHGEACGFLDDAVRQAASKEQRTVRSILDPRDPDDARLLEIGYYYSRGFSDGAGVRSIDKPAPGVNSTFREPPYGKHKVNDNPKDPIHATAAQVLTQQQMARLQGFPRNFRWQPRHGTIAIADVDQMIANAVPPAFAYYIAKAIRERHEQKSFVKVNKVFGAYLRKTTDLEDRSIDNVCSRVNRARKLLEARTYPDVDIEVAMLDRVFDRMQQAWDRNEELPADKRDPKVEKPFKVEQKSDMRAALRLYAAMLRPKSTVEKAIEKGEKEREKARKKRPPPLFPRRPSKWTPKWTIGDLLHSPVPTISRNRILTPRLPHKTNEEAYLADKAAQDFDPYPEDDGRLSPPALNTDEMWRPDGYDDD
ncbi:DNA cytosine methyltransferase [Rhizobium terrae]|uniref:DNA cytosine methyltransferase n=1 Tax=Rhizobium terrae TaxID=2171756 RepID=UPI000E3E9EED|nr:DNA cytosine methyltransferase [Rhizobium terrae]